MRSASVGLRRRALARTSLLLVMSASVVAGCGSGGSDDSAQRTTTTAAATTTTVPPEGAYSEPGPYQVGVTTLTLDDGNLAEVWYPAAEGAADGKAKDVYSLASWLPEGLRSKVPPDSDGYEQNAYRDVEASDEGPFPVVLFSHGFASFRDQSTFLTTHLASWGMVVAAPDHPSRGLLSVMGGENPDDATLSVTDMKNALAAVDAETSRAGGPLEGIADGDRVAAIGHSAGGRTILGLAADPEVGPRIDTYVSLASGAWDSGELPDVPSLFMSGTGDDIVDPAVTIEAYTSAPAPKRLYQFEGAGHLAFSDICAIGADQGGVLALADTFGIEIPADLRRLASDGCYPDETPPADVWPAVCHFTTAHLRAVWGIDPTPVGLDDVDAFDGLSIEVKHADG